MKSIKRYANRKLYDTETSSYVTLEEISRMVKDGVEFRIIDNRSKKDLTSLTLAQILCEEEKRQTDFLPLQALKGLIRSSESFLQRRVRVPLAEMRERTQETVERLIGRGEEGDDLAMGSADFEDAAPAGGAADGVDAPEPAGGEPADLRFALRDFFEQVQHNLEELVHGVDEQVRSAFEGVSLLPDLQKELQLLNESVARLEARVMELEASVPTVEGEPER